MQWKIIDSGRQLAQVLMNRDAEFLEQQALYPQPIIHLYEWEGPSLTHGYFTKPDQYLCSEALRLYDLNCAKRPTGGGIIFHLTDFAFSILLPSSHPHFSMNTLENYAYINQLVAQAIQPLINGNSQIELLKQEICASAIDCSSFCMAKPTQYDLIINGQKIGGAAQRRTKNGLLHQGSISLALPPMSMLRDVLKNGDSISTAMQQHSYTILKENWTNNQLQDIKKEIKERIVNI